MPLAAEVLADYLHQLSITENINHKWWSGSVRQFEQGHLAMLISYMNLFNDVAHSDILPKIGFAPVPGGVPQLGVGYLGCRVTVENHLTLNCFIVGFILLL